MELMKIISSGLKSQKLPTIFEEIADFLGAKDVGEALSRYLRLQILKSTVGEKWLRDVFSVFENPDLLVQLPKPKALPYHPKHITEIFFATLQKTVESSAYLGEEIGSECISEMLSEGLSSALESNYNASLQTILNVWRGSLPPDLSVAQALGQRVDLVETKYATSILAPTSALPYTILEALVQGAYNRLTQLYNNLDTQIASYLTTKSDYITSYLQAYLEHINAIMAYLIFDVTAFTERLENYVNQAVNVIMERLIARYDDLNAVKARHDIGLVSDEDYELMLEEIYADVNSLNDSFNQLKNEVNQLISDYVSKLSNIAEDITNLVINLLTDLETKLVELINKDVNAINALTIISDTKSKIKEIYERIRAYRQCGFDYS